MKKKTYRTLRRKPFEERLADFYARELRRIMLAKLIDEDGLRVFAKEALAEGRKRVDAEKERLAALAYPFERI